MIYEQHTFVNDQGQMIFGRVSVADTEMTFHAVFTTGFQVQDEHGNVGQMPIQTTVPLPGPTPSDAFNALPTAAIQATELAKQRMKKNREDALRASLTLPVHVQTNGHAPPLRMQT